MDTTEWIARNLAATMLSGVWTERALIRRVEKFLGATTKKSQRRLVRDVLDVTLERRYPPSADELIAILLESWWFYLASRSLQKHPQNTRVVLKSEKFAPAEPFKDLDVPKLTTTNDLAKWLGISINELDWFADRKRQQVRTTIPTLQHYRYSFHAKAVGPPRLIEAPKPRLKAIQRRILKEIINVVPPHDSAHGFVLGRSCVTASATHAAEAVVVTVDLKDFFLTTDLERVHGVFRSIGYPSAIARDLTALCSNMTPETFFLRLPEQSRHDWQTRQRFQAPHLPQGAPTSPALANFAAYKLDARISGLAKCFGANYTRYADDLAFSGGDPFARKIKSFLTALNDIIVDEGFTINARKTKIMRHASCQRVTGIVVNEHVNIPRATYDQLKATLHNCINTTPSEQNHSNLPNFRAHIEGRVSWVEHVNPKRGVKLRRMFNQVDW